jgi:hypothetical protein
MTEPATPAADLADRIDMLAKVTGERGGIADQAYRLAQSMRRDEIARTDDPARLDALTRDSGAAGQEYAAYLATLSGVQLDAAGQHDDADAMRREAETRREIAAELRAEPQQQPESLTLEAIEHESGEQAFDRARYSGAVLTSEAIRVHPYSAVALPLPDDASRALLIEAGQAIGHMYRNHEDYEHLAPNPATFQARLLRASGEIADALGDGGVTEARGELPDVRFGDAAEQAADPWTQAREGDHATGQTAQQPQEQNTMTPAPDFDANRATFRPGEQDYAVLRAETLTGLEAFEADLRKADGYAAPPVAASLAQNRAEIGAFMGVDPSGTFIYTGQTHSPADTPTDYENGPHRPGTVPEINPADAVLIASSNEQSDRRHAAELAVSQGERPSDPVQAALTGLEAFEADLRKADDYAATVAEITGREAGHVATMGGHSL